MAIDLAAAGTSAEALARHYDLPADFFRLWLGPGLVYSCGLWDLDDAADTLERAQLRKLDAFAEALRPAGGRVLDVGCGWGGLLNRAVTAHGAAAGVGLNLSPGQVEQARRAAVPGVELRAESWVTHTPAAPYDAIACVEATEHFARDGLGPADKVQVYQAFFERCAAWLAPEGRLALQLICLDQAGPAQADPGGGPVTELVRTAVFPESMSSSLSEMVLGWETWFRVERLLVHPEHYRATLRAWLLGLRAHQAQAEALVGPETTRTFLRYLAGAEVLFRLREQTLYRVVLARRPAPKRWAAPLRPPEDQDLDARGAGARGASAAGVRAHYDLPDDFYASWLGPTMVYTSGLWSEGAATLEEAVAAKVGFFAERVLPTARAGGPGPRVLDVGCGWGGPLRLLHARRPDISAVGLTLSRAQAAYLERAPVPGVEVELAGWAEHRPARPYDAILSFGAFEHFARDGLPRAERVAAYRRFFASCFDWLRPGGRLGLETIGHDDAPETAAPLGRGPLADLVLGLYPESLPPHLFELVCAFEPWFELLVLRSDAADFARTARAWLLGLRASQAAAEALVGAELATAFRRYLVSTEVQFRMGEITNYRLVLRRRPARRG